MLVQPGAPELQRGGSCRKLAPRTLVKVGLLAWVLAGAQGCGTESAAPSFGTGSALLSWTPPTLRVDGTPIGTVSGYRIYYGTSPVYLSSVVKVTGADVTSFPVRHLGRGTYYFAVAAVDSNGLEGALSTVCSKEIP